MAPRRHFGPRAAVLDIEGMDRDDLVIAALTRCPGIETMLGLYGCDDDTTVRRIGWHMACKIGADFRIGRRLLQLLSPGGYLMPPLEFRLSRQTEPTDLEMYRAPFVTPSKSN